MMKTLKQGDRVGRRGCVEALQSDSFLCILDAWRRYKRHSRAIALQTRSPAHLPSASQPDRPADSDYRISS